MVSSGRHQRTISSFHDFEKASDRLQSGTKVENTSKPPARSIILAGQIQMGKSWANPIQVVCPSDVSRQHSGYHFENKGTGTSKIERPGRANLRF